jgi:hypothetical protein
MEANGCKKNYKISHSAQIGAGQKYKIGHPDYDGHLTEIFSFFVGDVIPAQCM